MNYCDLTIDRIHQLIDRSQELIGQGMDYEAAILISEAEDHAKDLRSEFITA